MIIRTKIEYWKQGKVVEKDSVPGAAEIPALRRIDICCNDMAKRLSSQTVRVGREHGKYAWVAMLSYEESDITINFCPWCGMKIDTLETRPVKDA